MDTVILCLAIIGFLGGIAYLLKDSHEYMASLETQVPLKVNDHVELYNAEEATSINAGRRALKVSRMGNFALSWAYVQAEKGDFDSDLEYIELLTNEMAYRGLFRS